MDRSCNHSKSSLSSGLESAQPCLERVNLGDSTRVPPTFKRCIQPAIHNRGGEAGAHDAWITPIVMKKGRPGHTVHALCDESVRARVAEVLVTEMGTLGLRAHRVERWPQARDEITVTIQIDGDEHELSVKLLRAHTGRSDDMRSDEMLRDDVLRVDVEFSDAVHIARATGRPVREILEMAELAART